MVNLGSAFQSNTSPMETKESLGSSRLSLKLHIPHGLTKWKQLTWRKNI
jgi:hypothetical protein